MTNNEITPCQYRERDIHMTLVTHFSLVFFSFLRKEIRDTVLLISNSGTNLPSLKSSTKGQTPFGNATRLPSCSLSLHEESFLTLDSVVRVI